MSVSLFIILIVGIIEQIFSPRIDITRDVDVLLFYGRRKRKYIKLFNYETFK